MLVVALLAALGHAADYPDDPWTLVRVDDPDHPDAVAVSATGAVLLAPPPDGTSWRYEGVPEIDAVAVEAIDATNVDLWHADGLTGAGVKVAVFDLGWFVGEGDAAEVGDYQTHDCWSHPSCELPIDVHRPRSASEDNAHGWACAEVVRDIAPDAEIHLVRVNSFTQFENAADWAIREGIDVITMSMSYYNMSFYDGAGPFAPILEKLERHDVLLVTSAGNDAESHWEGRYLDGDGDGRMDLDGDNGLDVYVTTGTRQLYVNWDQYARCGDTDLDVVVYDGDGNVVGRAEDRQQADADRCEPIERVRIYAEEDGWYRLEISLHAGSATFLDVDLVGRAGVTIPNGIPEGSVVDPATHPFALAVGAVRANDYLGNDVEGFSSRGPTAAGLAKPDIAGPDGLSSAALGPVGFYGTSASTPVVAALVAVVMSEDPGLTPRQAARKLQGWALSDHAGFSQPDPRWGSGKARLPVRDPGPAPCGRRPLVMPLLFLPFWWRRKRR